MFGDLKMACSVGMVREDLAIRPAGFDVLGKVWDTLPAWTFVPRVVGVPLQFRIQNLTFKITRRPGKEATSQYSVGHSEPDDSDGGGGGASGWRFGTAPEAEEPPPPPRTRVLIMAGGTGGHVFPALAVAKALRDQGHDVHWLGTKRGLERIVVVNAAIPIEWLTIQGLRGKGVTGWLAAPWRLTRALWQAFRAFRRVRPDVVLGMGGFVSGPGGVVAWLTRTPLVIHEQNAIAGLTNRLLAPLATSVLEGFPGTFEDKRKAVACGNPVREEIGRIPAPEARLAGREGPIRVLVLGGSQGAWALNHAMPRAIRLLPPEYRPEVWHQAGKVHAGQTREWYQQAGVEARVNAFIKDMARAYAWADLVVCRSGALTIAELTLAGVGAILVPFPFAVDDHQRANGQFMVSAGAAMLIDQDEMDVRTLARQLAGLRADRGRLLAMAKAARDQARPNATDRVVAEIMAAAGVEPDDAMQGPSESIGREAEVESAQQGHKQGVDGGGP